MRMSLRNMPAHFVDRLKQLPELDGRRQRPANPGTAGAASDSTDQPHRVSVSRRRTSTTPSTTASVSGRFRRVFTQLNQYHLILEVQPEFRSSPDNLDDIYIISAGRHGGAAQRHHQDVSR